MPPCRARYPVPVPVHNFARPRGRVELLEVESDLLADNALGDPGRRTVAVYLPPAYDPRGAPLPLLVDLAAFTSSGLKRLSWTAFGESVPARLDRLVAAGHMPPVVLAFPDAFTSLGGNQYVDSPATGRWATFLATELVPFLERNLNLLPGRAHRGIYGKSSGGYGALVQGMTHPETWSAVACHSGDMGFDWLYRRDLPGVVDALARFDRDPVRFLVHLRTQPRVASSDFHTLMILAMAASYDPDPTAPAHPRLPVDLHTCELDEAAWARWLAHDPLHMVERPEVQANLRRLSLLFLDCGDRDPYFLHHGARALSRKLTQASIEHVYEEFPDGHSGIDYRLDRSLPLLARAVAP